VIVLRVISHKIAVVINLSSGFRDSVDPSFFGLGIRYGQFDFGERVCDNISEFVFVFDV
jgi:hypothetical protein